MVCLQIGDSTPKTSSLNTIFHMKETLVLAIYPFLAQCKDTSSISVKW